MVTSIVNHNSSGFPPTSILPIKILTNLGNKQQEGIAVVLTFVDSIEKVTMVTNASNYT